YKDAQVAAPASPQSEEAVEAISNFKATPLSPSNIKLTWNKGLFEDPVYIIERSTEGSEPTQLKVESSLMTFSVSYTDEGLDNNQTYSYRIKESGDDTF